MTRRQSFFNVVIQLFLRLIEHVVWLHTNPFAPVLSPCSPFLSSSLLLSSPFLVSSPHLSSLLPHLLNQLWQHRMSHDLPLPLHKTRVLRVRKVECGYPLFHLSCVPLCMHLTCMSSELQGTAHACHGTSSIDISYHCSCKCTNHIRSIW